MFKQNHFNDFSTSTRFDCGFGRERGRDHDRHHGRRGFRRGGPGFMGDFAGGDFPGGRKLDAIDIQLVILALLAEQPAHGYELIKTLEERSGGFYTPSPGVIYPALTYLLEIGHTSVEQQGTRKLYSITPEGKAHLEGNRASAEAILEALARIGGRRERVPKEFHGGGGSEGAAPGEIYGSR